MFTKDFIHKKLPLFIFLLAFFLFILSLVSNNIGGDTEAIARKTGQRLQKRLEILDRYVVEALDTEKCDLLEMNLPEDMVIYRYVNDSLQSWCNQFSIINDDISNRMIFQRISDMNSRIVSPLADVTEDLSFLSLGPKWYVVKMLYGENNEKIIAGIEIKNTIIDDIRRNDNGINPHLKIPFGYTVLPLHFTGGSPVVIDGKPLFKILYDNSASVPFFNNSFLRWLGLMLLIIAILLSLDGK